MAPRTAGVELVALIMVMMIRVLIVTLSRWSVAFSGLCKLSDRLI